MADSRANMLGTVWTLCFLGSKRLFPMGFNAKFRGENHPGYLWAQKVREHTELNKHILAYYFYRFWLYDIVWQVMQIEHQIVTRLFKNKMERNDIIMECEDHLRDLWTYRWWLWKIPVIRIYHFIIKFNIPIMSISNRINKFFKQRQKGKNSNMSKICERPEEEHNMKDGATKTWPKTVQIGLAKWKIWSQQYLSLPCAYDLPITRTTSGS